MQFNVRKLFKRALLYLSLAYLLTYALYHVTYFVFDSEWLHYVQLFVRKATFLLIPLASSAVTLAISAYRSTKEALLRAIPLSLVRMIYFIPYFYMMNYTDMWGFASSEAILYALLLALGEVILSYVISVLVFALMYFIVKRKLGSDDFSVVMDRYASLNLESPVSVSFMVCSVLVFLYFFISEIIDTVSFFKQASGSFYTAEIIYIVISFIFDIALLFIHFFTLCYVKNKSALAVEEE